MELKKFIERIKNIKSKTTLLDLVYETLKLEELLIENAGDTSRHIKQLGEVLYQSFLLTVESKIDINDKNNKDLDLDNWKNNLKKYKLVNKVEKEIYLYTIRNTLKNLIPVIDTKDELSIKVYLFELIIKTFLYIDYLDLSIDTILEAKLKTIKVPEKKEEEIKPIP